jgi:hypothetical protein
MRASAPVVAFPRRNDFFRNLFSPGAFSARDSGMISASGSPKRITRTGWRVLRTCSRIVEHLTLNSEKPISLIEPYILTIGAKAR